MQRKSRPIGTLFAAFLLAAPSLGAQQITGRVLDQRTGQPMAAVQVFVAGSGIGALSQQNGRYLLLNVPAGTHTLTAQRIGYRDQTADVTVAAGETVLIVDDLLATGGTAGAGIKLLERLGADIVGCAFIIDLPELGGRKLLETLGMDVHILCEFEGA